MNESFKRSNGDARARRRASSMRRDRRAVFSFSRRRSARERWRANECRVAVDCAPLLRMCITQKSLLAATRRARVKTWVWSAWKTIDGDSHSPTSMRDDAAARTLLLAPPPPSPAPPLAAARQAPRNDSDVATIMDPHATNAAHTPAEAPKKAR